MERERNVDAPVMAPEAYEFGEFRVDLRTVELTRNGQPVPLEPKAFDVLRCLIEGRDRLLTKDQLLDLAWRDTFVTPNALTRVIAQLRRALGDDAEESRFIATVAKRGYRWIAPVRAIGGSPIGAGVEAPRAALPIGPSVVVRRRPLRLVAVLAVPIVLGAVGWVWSQSRHSEPAAQPSPRSEERRVG